MARSGLVPIFYKSIQNTTSLNGLSQPHNPKLDLNLFHVYHTSGTFLKQCHHPLHLHRVQPLCAMSKPRMPPFSSLIPQLTPDNFLEWQVCVKAYLTPSDHVCMVEQVRTMGGAYVDPLPLSDPLISRCGNQPSISALVPSIASVSSASVATKSAGVAAFLLLPQVMSRRAQLMLQGHKNSGECRMSY